MLSSPSAAPLPLNRPNHIKHSSSLPRFFHLSLSQMFVVSHFLFSFVPSIIPAAHWLLFIPFFFYSLCLLNATVMQERKKERTEKRKKKEWVEWFWRTKVVINFLATGRETLQFIEVVYMCSNISHICSQVIRTHMNHSHYKKYE